MLYQIGLSYTHPSNVLFQLRHYVQLVVAGEYQLLGVLHDVRHLLLRLCLIVVEQHIVHDDVCHRVLLQHLFPEVGGLVALRVHGVPCTLPLCQSSVEGHEERLAQIQAGGEEHLVFVEREVSQTTSILQQRLLRVSVFPVLLLSVVSGCLMCPGILQLKCKQRDAVNE